MRSPFGDKAARVWFPLLPDLAPPGGSLKAHGMPRVPKSYDQRDIEYENQPEQVRRRVARNRARHEAMKAGLVRKGDGKEVHHLNASLKGKTKIVSRHTNRQIGKPPP
jgi:hypothetical protein